MSSSSSGTQKAFYKQEATIDTLAYIHRDTQEGGSKEGVMQNCLSRMRNVMYGAEDLFDALAAKILHKRTMTGNAFTKEVRLFFSDANQLGLIYKTAHAIKEIRESLDDIKKDMEIYGLIMKPLDVDQPFVRPKTQSFVHEEDVIGRDEDRDSIIKMLLAENIGEKRLSVIAVIGFGGLGKTTLARYVYNHKSVEQGFDVHLWACIAKLDNLEQVLVEIIASKEGKHLEDSLEKLKDKLREIISGKKFILVLDDVWDEDLRNWQEVEPILRCGEIGSKVLATTRSNKVVECLDVFKPNCVDLTLLSKDSAWSLFVKKAFYKQEELDMHPELEPLGMEIVDRCGYVPLAIAIAGSTLRHKEKGLKIWSDFLENDLKRIIFKGGDKNQGSIKSVLMASYNHLPSNLKLCFGYCSLFPKDCEFDKDALVRLWIAQGFIKRCADNEQSLEKEGEDYFFQLVERCFFQEVKQNQYRHTAKMHDLLHDVAIDVAKAENRYLDKVPATEGELDGFRHISIDFDLEDCSLVSNPKKVRTLLLFCPYWKFTFRTFESVLESFTMLRTLYLFKSRIDGVPESIGGLIHLRYLDLSGNYGLKHLLDSICKIHHLMILVLQDCRRLEKLPPRIEKMVTLRQLFIHGCDKLDYFPSGVKVLTSLVNLDRLIVHRRDGWLGFLKDLNNLEGVLRIELPEEGWVDAIEDAKKANMARKNKLNKMVIKGEIDNSTLMKNKFSLC